MQNSYLDFTIKTRKGQISKSLIFTQIPVRVTDGFVPDEDTAIAVALAVWKPVYGNKVKSSRHYEATLENEIWYVNEKVTYGLFSSSGGELYMEIDKKTGQIIKMYSTK